MGNELQRWADKAMFQAEEMPEEARKGPQVHLLGMTADPLGHIAAACKIYKGEVVRSLSDVTHAERKDYLAQMQKTKLQAGLEFVDFHFLIEGVSRALTHQMVRQRTAVYAQESMRFAVKESIDEETYLPPSLAVLPQHHELLKIWRRGINAVEDSYHALIAAGIPAEDARGLIPTNILTRIHYKTNLRNLLDHAGNRLCTQAQFEWRLLWARIKEAVRTYEPHAAMIRSTEAKRGPSINAQFLRYMDGSDSWQYEAISELFKPVCYLTGKCEFKASFDRPCKIRDRVDANEERGRPSSEWEQEYDVVEGNPIVVGVGPKSVVRDNDRPVFIGAIRPAEWLLDPGAAR